jgi:hypothetical protein
MASNYNLEIIQGNSFILNVNAQNSDGSFINLSGYGARGHVRYQYSSTGILLDLQPSVHNSYISGLVSINIPSTGTVNLPIGVFPYDLEITGANNYCLKYLRGYANVLPEATK